MPLCFHCPRQSSVGTSLVSPTVTPAQQRGWTRAQRSPLGCEQSRPHATQILAQRGARLPASTASAAAARNVNSAWLVGRIRASAQGIVCVSISGSSCVALCCLRRARWRHVFARAAADGVLGALALALQASGCRGRARIHEPDV